MELNKHHKVLAGILALGAGAVIIDRVVLESDVSGPAAASASVPQNAERRDCVISPSPTCETLTARASQVKAIPIDSAELANAFVVPAGWTVAEPSLQHSIIDSGTVISHTQFRLSSVMTRPVAAAVINGNMLRAGHDYSFGVCNDGKFGVLKQDELRQLRKQGGTNISVVRLISVEPRSQDSEGGAVIEVDGTRVSLVIEQSEKHK